MSVKDEVDKFIDYCKAGRLRIRSVTVSLTETYVRRRLGLKKRDRLKYRGFRILIKPRAE